MNDASDTLKQVCFTDVFMACCDIRLQSENLICINSSSLKMLSDALSMFHQLPKIN